MAITIRQQPAVLAPAYNPMMFVVTSSNHLQANFRYVADVYVNAVLAERIKVPKHPTYNNGVFDISKTIESYVTKDFSLTSTSFQQNNNSLLTYEVKFGEEYGLSSSGTTVYPNQTLSGDKYAWNSIFDFENYVAYDHTDYLSGNAGSQFLTTAPNDKQVYIDDQYTSGNEFLYMINASSGSIYFVNVNTFDSNGNPLGEYKIQNSFQASPYKNVRIAAGANMNSIAAPLITATLGTTPIITASVASYQIYASNFAGTTTINAPKTFTINRTCSRYKLYEVYFMNKLGGYDTHCFELKSTFKTNVERQNYKKGLGEVESSNVHIFSANQRGTTQYYTSLKDTIVLRSEYISEDTLKWLEQLVTSPDVYIYSSESSTYVPVIVTDSMFERKQLKGDKLFNLEITIEYSYNRKRQRW